MSPELQDAVLHARRLHLGREGAVRLRVSRDAEVLGHALAAARELPLPPSPELWSFGNCEQRETFLRSQDI